MMRTFAKGMLVLFTLLSFAGLVFAFMAGCATTPRTHAPAAPGSPAPMCLGSAPMVYAGSCGDLVTPEGWSCAICGDERGCVTTGMSWCTGPAACDDPRCAPPKARR